MTDFFDISELLQLLDASLVRIASDVSINEEEKIVKSLAQVCDTAGALEVVWMARGNLSVTQMDDYAVVKARILVYLLYYDRINRWLQGNSAPGDWYRTDMFPPADYNDWRDAQSKARKLFVNYIRDNKIMEKK